jgi:hypothetical protein
MKTTPVLAPASARLAIARLALAAVLLVPAALVAQEQAPPPPGCGDTEQARQLDFWVGTWDVVHPETGDTLGVNVIEPILHGCALMESWTGARGGTGKSLNFWDSQRRTWRQVWVADRGNVLDYRHGEYRDGAMHFRGITIRDGDTTHQKLTFVDVAPDTVRQVFERSSDGESWETTWVGIYLRRPSP